MKRIKAVIANHLPGFVLRKVPLAFLSFKCPSNVLIEVTNCCNLKCAMCPTPISKRERGFIKFDDFKKIIEDFGDHRPQLTLYFGGEPLLHKELFKMVKYAADKGFKTYISTNATLIHKNLDGFFNSGLDKVTVCLDGATKKTHESYRRGSDFDVVKRNIRMLCEEKRKRGAEKPEIILQTLAMRSNEKEIPEIFKLAEEFRVDFFDIKTLGLGYSNPGERMELAKKFLPNNPDYNRYIIKESKIDIKSKSKFCSAITTSVVLWNGDVCLCCFDYDGKHIVGNIFKDGGFMKLYRSKKYAKFRRMVLNRQLPMCKSCNESSEYTKRFRIGSGTR